MSPAIAAILLCVFGVSAMTTRFLVGSGARRWLLDHPNERSLHDQPVPRSGGLAIALGIVSGGVAVALLTRQLGWLSWVGVGFLVILGVSFRDDVSHVNKGVRMAFHVFVALLLVYAGLEIDAFELPGLRRPLPGWLAVVVTCLYTVWMINAYNFMDGMDGSAAGMAVFGFGTFALLGTMADQTVFAALSGVVAAAAGGFLLFNFPPARIFMGDSGSSVLGFVAAALSLWASVDGIFPLWTAVLVFSPFIVDATFTLARRIWRRERFWESHKSHCYQRLVDLGWGHRKMVLWMYSLMILCAASAVAGTYLTAGGRAWLIISWAVLYVILILFVHHLEGRIRSRETVEPL